MEIRKVEKPGKGKIRDGRIDAEETFEKASLFSWCVSMSGGVAFDPDCPSIDPPPSASR